jgi:hypothetical protein
MYKQQARKKDYGFHFTNMNKKLYNNNDMFRKGRKTLTDKDKQIQGSLIHHTVSTKTTQTELLDHDRDHRTHMQSPLKDKAGTGLVMCQKVM